MTWSAVPGATFLCPYGSSGKHHLYIVVSEIVDLEGEPRGQCASVCVCSVPGANVPYDATMILEGGAHSFIQHKSYVAFRHAQMFVASDLEAKVNAGSFPARDPFKLEVVNPVRDAMLASPQTPNFLKKLLRSGAL